MSSLTFRIGLFKQKEHASDNEKLHASRFQAAGGFCARLYVHCLCSTIPEQIEGLLVVHETFKHMFWMKLHSFLVTRSEQSTLKD